MSELKFISPETIEQAVDAYSKSSKEGKMSQIMLLFPKQINFPDKQKIIEKFLAL